MVLISFRIYHYGIEYSYLDAINECQSTIMLSSRMRLFFGEGFEPYTILYNENIWPYRVVSDGDLRLIKCKSGNCITIADVIKKMLSDIETKWKRISRISRAVLMVPSFFNSATKRAILTAFQSNDIQLIEMLNTTSALISTCNEIIRRSHEKYTLTFDLDSGEATIFNNGKNEIVATCEIFEIKLNETPLLNYVVENFCGSIKKEINDIEDVSFKSVIKKMHSSISIKHNETIEIDSNDFIGANFKYELTPMERDELYKVFQSRIIKIINDFIDYNKINRENITYVIFCNPSFALLPIQNQLINAAKQIIPRAESHEKFYNNINEIYLSKHSNFPTTNSTDQLDGFASYNPGITRSGSLKVNKVTLKESSDEVKALKIENAELKTQAMIMRLQLEDTRQHNLINSNLLIDELNQLKKEKKELMNHTKKLKYQLTNIGQIGLKEELETLKKDITHLEVQFESLVCQINTIQASTNIENRLNEEIDKLMKDNLELDTQLKDLKLNEEEDSKIGGIHFVQGHCRAALVDQPQSPIWEDALEDQIEADSSLRAFNELKNATKMTSAVIAVDGYTTENDRHNLVYSVTMSRVSVLRVVNDTTAIIAAYECYNDQKNHCILMLDVNERRFQITAVKVESGQTKILLNATNDQFTEMVFDEAVIKYCCEAFNNDTNLNLLTIDMPGAQIALQRLKEPCKQAQKRLLYFNPTRIDVGVLYCDVDFSIRFSKTTCYQILGKYLDGLPTFISKSLRQIQLERQAITDVILVGDFAPFFEHFVEEKFPRAVIHQTQDSDEIVARGAAILAKAAIENPNPNFKQFIERKLTLTK